MKLYQRFIKRALDIVLSGIALVLLSPVFIIVYFLVKTKLGSPVLFIQERPGKDGNIFMMYKFRTMTEERGKDGDLLPDNIRLTKFGKLLRSTSLDELPELWNILIGDMSIVGPRPLLVQYLPLYNPFQRQRHNVRPGLTGLAQVKGRNALTWDEKFKWDIEYINDVTFMNDVKIILMTVVIVFKRDGIASEESVTMEHFKGNEK